MNFQLLDAAGCVTTIAKQPFPAIQNKPLFVQPFPAHTGLRYQDIEQPLLVWSAA